VIFDISNPESPIECGHSATGCVLATYHAAKDLVAGVKHWCRERTS